MKPHETPAFVAAIGHAFNRQMDPAQVPLWHRELGHVSAADANAALSAFLRKDPAPQFPPTLPQILALIPKPKAVCELCQAPSVGHIDGQGPRCLDHWQLALTDANQSRDDLRALMAPKPRPALPSPQPEPPHDAEMESRLQAIIDAKREAARGL